MTDVDRKNKTKNIVVRCLRPYKGYGILRERERFFRIVPLRRYNYKDGNVCVWQSSVGRGKTEISVFGSQSVSGQCMHSVTKNNTFSKIARRDYFSVAVVSFERALD